MNQTTVRTIKYPLQSNKNRIGLAKKVLLLTLIAGVASSVLPAHAQDYYVGADLVAGNYTLNDGGATPSVGSSSDSQSWKIFAGYNFNKAWAIEGGYVDFGSANYNVADSSGAGSLRVNANSWYAAAKGTIPLNESFSLYGKLGVARNHFDQAGAGVLGPITESADQASLYFGIGAQYKLSQNVDVVLGLDHFGVSKSVGDGSTVVSTGLRYSF